MDLEAIVIWLLTGLIAGGFSSTLAPRPARAALLAVGASGVCGALLGGWGWALLLDQGPSSFLGAVIPGVTGSLATLYLVRHVHSKRPA